MMRLVITPIIVLLIFIGVAFSQSPSPSPTCNPTSVQIRFVPDEPDPTYYPGQDFVLHVAPVQGSDWPTTPTEIGWGSDYFPMKWTTSDTEHYAIPVPAPDTIYFDVMAFGNGIRPDCPKWKSNGISLTARRYDYVPTPTPVPTVSPTPSPTPSGVCPPPDGECADIVRWPEDEQQNLPTSFTLVHNAVRFLHLETSSGVAHPYTILDDQHVAVEGLAYSTWYMWYYVADERYCPWIPDVSRRICWSMFKTMPSPTPTPSPSPTVLTPTPPPRPSREEVLYYLLSIGPLSAPAPDANADGVLDIADLLFLGANP
jgi:hypothetical protein